MIEVSIFADILPKKVRVQRAFKWNSIRKSLQLSTFLKHGNSKSRERQIQRAQNRTLSFCSANKMDL